MSDSSRLDDIVRRVAGAEILAFPRAIAPAAANDASSFQDTPVREDAGSREDADGGRGSTGGDDGNGLDRRLARYPLTDLGNAERFADRHREALRYCPALGWLAWDGRRWKRDGADEAVKLAEHATVRAIQDEAEAIRWSADDVELVPETKTKPAVWLSDKVKAWGRVSEAAPKLASISKRAAAMLAIEADALDRDPMKINVQNGTLHVQKREGGPYIRLEPHDPEDFITALSPVSYDPKAECPRFLAFLAEIQPTADVRLFLQQWAGYSLTGDTGEQKMIFCYGKGRNGKGVLVNMISHVAGDYADSIPIESFLDSGRARAGGQATPDIADLPGVRCLTTSEPKKGAVLDEAFVKLFTGGDPIKARHLNRDFFEFRPQAKLLMQGNYRPKISGTDEGIWNRMVLVPFPVFIPPHKQDPRLFAALKDEDAGVLNWMLDGLVLWLDRGLLMAEDVAAATASYRADSDPLGRFLEACTRQALGKRVQATELHALFEAWAKVNGETQWSPKGLQNAMTERGFASKKSSVMYWLDVELTRSPRDFVDEHGRPLHADAGDGGSGESEEPPYILPPSQDWEDDETPSH